MVKNFQRTSMAIITVGTLGVAGQVSAATLNIDFGRAGTEAGGNWNNVTTNIGNDGNLTVNGSAGSSGELTDFVTGLGSGVTMSLVISSDTAAGGGGSDYAGPYPAAVSSLAAAATSDSFYLNAGKTLTVTLTGLDAAKSYEILFYGSRGNNGNQTDFSATGNGAAVTGSISDVFNNATQAPVLTVTPDNSNTIVLTITDAANAATTSGALNLISITEVPEPGSLALLGLGGLMVAARRRRD